MGAKLGQNNVKGEQTKIAVVNAAEQVFAESGYRGSSLATVAERAGVTQSGLLHHFRTKEQLLAAVLEQQEARDRPPAKGSPVLDGLEATADDTADRVAVRLFAVLAAECTAVDHPGHDHMRDHYERLRHRLVGALSTEGPWKIDGEELDVDDIATALIATLHGIRLQWIYNPKVDMSGAFHVVTSLLRNAAKVEPGE